MVLSAGSREPRRDGPLGVQAVQLDMLGTRAKPAVTRVARTTVAATWWRCPKPGSSYRYDYSTTGRVYENSTSSRGGSESNVVSRRLLHSVPLGPSRVNLVIPHRAAGDGTHPLLSTTSRRMLRVGVPRRARLSFGNATACGASYQAELTPEAAARAGGRCTRSRSQRAPWARPCCRGHCTTTRNDSP